MKGTRSNEIRLRRSMALHHGVAVICGLVIGGGIYISPKGDLAWAGSPGLALVLWGFCGCLGTVGALTFAEIGTTFPRSGEMYHYLDQMYGPFIAFLYLWCYLLLMRPAANAIKLLTFAKYSLQLVYADCDPADTPVVLTAVSLCCLLTFVNTVNVKWSARWQTVASGISLVALVCIGITGLFYIGMGHTKHIEDGFRGSTTNPGDLILALYSCVFAVSGWSALNFMTEELKSPSRNLPLAIGISMLLVTVLYVLVNTAYIVVLGAEGVLASDVVALSFTQKTFGTAVAAIMSVVIALNTAGSFNSGILVASRLCFVGARREHLPEFLSYISIRFITPITALVFQALLTIFMAAFVDIFTLINNSIFAYTLFEALTVAGTVWLRFKQPNLRRPLKIPLALILLFLVVDAIMVIVPLVTNPWETATGLAVGLCTGIPYYIIFVLWAWKPTKYRRCVARMNHFIQKLFLCVRQSGSTDI